MIRTRRLLGAGLVVAVIGVTTAAGVMAKGPRNGRADLSGYQEVPMTLSSPATGTLDLTIAPNDSEISYVLTYDGFVNNVTQSHIHLGRPALNGGIMLYFCTNLAPPAGVPAPPPCPLHGGTVEGTLTAANVFGGANGQGVATTDFEEVLDALREEATYANVHTNIFPGGEIRGQVLFHANGAAIR